MQTAKGDRFHVTTNAAPGSMRRLFRFPHRIVFIFLTLKTVPIRIHWQRPLFSTWWTMVNRRGYSMSSPNTRVFIDSDAGVMIASHTNKRNWYQFLDMDHRRHHINQPHIRHREIADLDTEINNVVICAHEQKSSTSAQRFHYRVDTKAIRLSHKGPL